MLSDGGLESGNNSEGGSDVISNGVSLSVEVLGGGSGESFGDFAQFSDLSDEHEHVGGQVLENVGSGAVVGVGVAELEHVLKGLLNTALNLDVAQHLHAFGDQSKSLAHVTCTIDEVDNVSNVVGGLVVKALASALLGVLVETSLVAYPEPSDALEVVVRVNYGLDFFLGDELLAGSCLGEGNAGEDGGENEE